MERPKQVTIIGRMWVAFGISLLLILAWNFVFFPHLELFRIVGFIFLLCSVFAAMFFQGFYFTLSIAWPVFMIVFAVYFLRLRPWARKALVVLSWIGSVYLSVSLLVLLILSFSWRLLEMHHPFWDAGGRHPGMCLATVVVDIFAMVAFLVLFIVTVRLLGGKAIREAFQAKVVSADADNPGYKRDCYRR